MTSGNRGYSPQAGGAARQSARADSRPSITSGRAGRGEAPALPDANACGDRVGTWGGIQRHRRAGQPRCDACRKFASDYSREWYRESRAIPAFRERHNAVVRESHRRQRSTPEGRAADNAKARARKRDQQRRAEHDARHAIDAVVVERLIAGELVPHNRAEKVAALHQLLARGLTRAAAARYLGLNGKYARKYADLIEQGDVA